MLPKESIFFPLIVNPLRQCFLDIETYSTVQKVVWECSGSVVECLTRDRGAASSSLTGVTALCP